jgi:hypothetical protein
LNGTNEVSEELEDQVLLLLLHLVETVLLAALRHLLLSKTGAGVGLELILRHNATGGRVGLLLLLRFLMAVLRLQLVNQGVHVLILLLILDGLLFGDGSGHVVWSVNLLIESA